MVGDWHNMAIKEASILIFSDQMIATQWLYA
jgi:hypothetical protein